ncbi:AmmeMemoRadiSam system protein B [Patescibacteria group bacterium]|nr:AmmeMemoRadiSam system protein B [Patescibacteria group bacterium]MBU1931452.1 AmmeMemoRadiSam system protein B [Patescibacteria group bacterium]
MTKIRLPAVAGQFYPAEPERLKEQVNAFLQAAPSIKISGKLRALIVPHAGYVFSGPVAAVGYKLLKKARLKKPEILLLGSSHHHSLNQPVGASFTAWQTPLGQVKAKNLTEFDVFDQAHLDEHSLEVQLPFLQQSLEEFRIIPLLLNHFNAQLVDILSNLINQIRFIIVSSDLSHYHNYDQAVAIDSLANQVIPQLDFDRAGKIEACGLGAILTLIKLAQQKGWQAKLLDYKNSGAFGDKTRVVGYGCYGFFE